MDPNVPLVVTQVNPDDLERHEGIIANPNCSTMQLVPVLMALRDAVGLERVVVDTYRPSAAPAARRSRSSRPRSRRTSAASRSKPRVYPHQIAFNALPQVDVFLDNGYTKEEWKVVTESRKILHLPDLRVSCTAVRVPVFVGPQRGGPRRDPRADHARSEPGPCSPPCPASSSRTTHRPRRTRSRPRPPARDEIYVGRVRQDPSIDDGRGLAFWVVSDNLRKGAATNAVQLAEILVERGWVKAAAARNAAGTGRRDRRRAPGGARGDRRRGPRLHALPPPRDPHEGRPRRGRPSTPRSCSSARARA